MAAASAGRPAAALIFPISFGMAVSRSLYQGSYRDYPSSTFHGGTQQSLAIAYSKRLSKRWSFGANVSAAFVVWLELLGASALGASISTNPFSSESRLSMPALMSLTLSRGRLSYVFGGAYFLNNYSYNGSFSSYGGEGNAAIFYA